MGVNNSNEDSQYRVMPDFFKPIKIMIDNMSVFRAKLGLSDYYQLDFVEESDFKVLSLWKKYGFIEDDSEPVLILAPKKFIRTFLYLDGVNTLGDAIDFFLQTNSLQREDISKFSNTGYRAEFYKRFLSLPVQNSFELDANAKPDILAIPEEIQSYIELAGIPVFKHNMKNANITELNLNYPNQLMSVFDLGIKKALHPIAVNYVKPQLETFARESVPPDLVNYVRSRLDPDEFSDVKKLFPRILSLLNSEEIQGSTELLLPLQQSPMSKNLTIESLALYISMLLFVNTQTDKPVVEIDYDEDPFYVQKSINDRLQKLHTEVKLRTLPFFGISGWRSIGKLSFLMSIRNKIVGATSTQDDVNPYSGFYRVLGFRHYISSDECFSEFQLIKENNVADSFYNNSDRTIEDLMKSLIGLSKDEVGESPFGQYLYHADNTAFGRGTGLPTKDGLRDSTMQKNKEALQEAWNKKLY